MIICRYSLSHAEKKALRDARALCPLIVPDGPVQAVHGSPLEIAERPGGDEVAYRSDALLAHLPADSGLPRAMEHLGKRYPVLILADIPIEQNAGSALFLIGSLIGQVTEFVGHGAPVVEVSDKMASDTTRPSSDNSHFFDPHTDLSFSVRPPDYVGFLMLRQGAEGGESLFCDGQDVVADLPGETIEELHRPFRFPSPPHRPGDPARDFPVLESGRDGTVLMRYRKDGLSGQSAAQSNALALFHEAIADHSVRVLLNEGEMAVYSNRTVLHGRERFMDGSHSQRRLALRAYFDRCDAERIARSVRR